MQRQCAASRRVGTRVLLRQAQRARLTCSRATHSAPRLFPSPTWRHSDEGPVAGSELPVVVVADGSALVKWCVRVKASSRAVWRCIAATDASSRTAVAMECSADVVLRVRDMDALHCCLDRIRTLFNVRPEIVSVDDAVYSAPDPGLATGYPPAAGRSVRLKLWADTASKPSALKASKVSGPIRTSTPARLPHYAPRTTALAKSEWCSIDGSVEIIYRRKIIISARIRWCTAKTRHTVAPAEWWFCQSEKQVG